MLQILFALVVKVVRHCLCMCVIVIDECVTLVQRMDLQEPGKWDWSVKYDYATT